MRTHCLYKQTRITLILPLLLALGVLLGENPVRRLPPHPLQQARVLRPARHVPDQLGDQVVAIVDGGVVHTQPLEELPVYIQP